MTNVETKYKIIDALSNRGFYFKKVNAMQYRVPCPYCENVSRTDDGHMYIKIDVTTNTPIVYFCFKCPHSGVLTKTVLEDLEITDESLLGKITELNKTSDKFDSKNLTGSASDIVFFDFKLPKPTRGPKISYIEKRLGCEFTDVDLKEMKIVTSIKDFLKLNQITEYSTNPYYIDLFEDYYVGFLSNGNSHLLLRDISETQKFRWIKYPILQSSTNNRIFYTMESSIDVFSEDEIIINLSEGVLDILSVKHNLGYSGDNVFNICVTGKYYEKILFLMVEYGLCGSNVTINIFSDNDADFNKKEKKAEKGKYNKKTKYDTVVETDIEYFKSILHPYKYLFGKINIFYNQIYKDCGTTKENIILKKHIL